MMKKPKIFYNKEKNIIKTKAMIFLFITIFLISSCESKQAEKERLIREEKQKIELEKQKAEEEKTEAVRLEKFQIKREKKAKSERIEHEAQIKKERNEEEIYKKYINNSLRTGSTPYSRYYGGNSSCNDYGCSEIKVRASNSDVLVTIKKNEKVIKHAFIQSGDSYTFSFPNGEYQTFFYYGKGWNPEKKMKNGKIKGGFITDEHFGKDDLESLHNNILEYELILQKNGNFTTRPSNSEEAL